MNNVLGDITLIQVADLGKIKFATFNLDGERLVRFAGPNEAGKSTVIDVVQTLFTDASKIPDGIIRHGLYTEGRKAGQQIDSGMARIETSNGYIVERIVRLDKNGKQVSQLTVTQNGMPVTGGPLNFLKSISSKYPDPQKVSELEEGALFKELFELSGVNLDGFNKGIEDAKEEAKLTRRELSRLGAEKQEPAERPIEVEGGIQNLYSRQTELKLKQQSIGTEKTELGQRITRSLDQIESAEKEIIRLKGLINEKQESVNLDKLRLEVLEKEDYSEEILELDTQIEAFEKNSALFQAWSDYESDQNLRKAYQETLRESAETVQRLEIKKREALLSAELPINDLELTEEGYVVRQTEEGAIRWNTLSHSARIALATELCIATIPDGGVRAIYIQRGESIGSDKRKILAELARKHDVQIFMEVFTEDAIQGAGVFTLEEGEILEAQPKFMTQEELQEKFDKEVGKPAFTTNDNYPVDPFYENNPMGGADEEDIPDDDLF
jgi:hypothetical protein